LGSVSLGSTTIRSIALRGGTTAARSEWMLRVLLVRISDLSLSRPQSRTRIESSENDTVITGRLAAFLSGSGFPERREPKYPLHGNFLRSPPGESEHAGLRHGSSRGSPDRPAWGPPPIGGRSARDAVPGACRGACSSGPDPVRS